MSAPAIAKAKAIKVVDFLRVSTDRQDVNKQRRDCATNRKTFGLETERALEIEGLSGTDTLTDEAVQKLLREMERPDIHLNLSSLDRLFRPAKDPGQFAILRVFKDAKKLIFSAREGIIDLNTTEGYQKALAAGMQSAIEWLILRERTMKGHLDALSGLYDTDGSVIEHPKPMNTTAPFGYTYIKKHDATMRCPACDGTEKCTGQRFVIDEEKAVWVRRAFAWARAGVKPFTIAQRFVEAGVVSQGYNGKPGEIGWHPAVIRQMLHKKKYIGEIETAKGITIVDPYVIRAIIDRQLFEDVQDVLARSREMHQGQPPKGNAQFKHLLRKFFYHGIASCGRRYHTNQGIRGNGQAQRPYYVCGKIAFKPYHHLCDSTLLYADLIEPIAWAIVWEVLSDPALLLKLGTAYFEKMGKPDGDRVEALERERETLNGQREELVEMIKNRIIQRNQGYEQIYTIDARLKAIDAEMRAAGRVVNLPSLHQAQAALANITRDEPDDFEGRRAILEKILDLRFTYANGEITAEGKITVPVESTSCNQKYSKGGLGAPSSTFSPIPFVINRRVA